MIDRLQNIFPFFWQGLRNSYTQIFFSNHKILGYLLIFVTLFDVNAGISGLIAVSVTNTAAYLMGLNRQQIIHGLYGFNSLLVGLGLGLYFQPGWSFSIILIFASLLTLLVTVSLAGILGKYGLPYLSLPFLAGIWIVMLSTREITHLDISERGIYTLNEMYTLGGLPMMHIYDWFDQINWAEPIKIYFRSLGAIFFQYHLFAGLVIALGILLWSRMAWLLSVIGFAAAYLFYQVVGANINELGYTYIGFNYILTAIAIGGFFTVPSVYSILWVILSIPLLAFFTISGNAILAPLQLSVFSLPFNMVVIMFLYVFKLRERFYDKPGLVYVQQFNPEKNLYSSLVNRSRLAHLEKIEMKLPFWGFWKVTQGINGQHTHKESWRHAWDFEMTDDEGKTYRNQGDRLEDYYCFGKPVVAAASGYVTEVVDTIEDNQIGDMNLNFNWGNTVVISHTTGLFSQSSHLKLGTVLVKKGQYVQKGQQIASCGNSGRSPYPHLHFQFQSASEIGSHTLDYPFAAYLSRDPEIKFHSSDQPLLDQLVSNNIVDDQLDKALHFIPGQEIKFKRQDSEEEIVWQVETDIYNKSYLLCKKTQSKAWINRLPDMFYFTHFEGNRNSYLYDFYLAAYQVVTGAHKGLVIEDQITLSEFPIKWMRILQDFVAPFKRFLETAYRIEYVKTGNTIGAGLIELKAEVRFKWRQKTITKKQYTLTFVDSKLSQFVIYKNDQEIFLNRE